MTAYQLPGRARNSAGFLRHCGVKLSATRLSYQQVRFAPLPIFPYTALKHGPQSTDPSKKAKGSAKFI